MICNSFVGTWQSCIWVCKSCGAPEFLHIAESEQRTWIESLVENA